MKRSPLAPARFPDLPVIEGARFATVAAGVRYKDRPDVMLAELAEGTTIAGVFTRSATRAAPVLDCEAKIDGTGTGRAAILVNSGNANAFTGAAGEASVNAVCSGVAETLGIDPDRVFTSSTGVIGEPLPHDKVLSKLSELAEGLAPNGIEMAARAIMTTDTFAKGAMAEVEIAGKPVRIAGIAKGSGMIAPDMATMLVYIFTDAMIGQAQLQTLLRTLTDQTFNCITVDSDTSTSDTLLCAATGASGVDVTDSAGFTKALHDVMLDLARLCAMAKAPASSSRCRSAARRPTTRRGRLALPSPIPRWSRRLLPVKTRIGAASSWP
jgi:glutamate N-acetyltransferase/amino-acid N-acetyltransferase